MKSKFFAVRLLPPRPSFAQDMSPDERSIMQQHVAYWMDLMKKGNALVFGPVLDPKGVYGLGIINVDSDKELQTLLAHDPANGLNRYEWDPMLAVVPS